MHSSTLIGKKTSLCYESISVLPKFKRSFCPDIFSELMLLQPPLDYQYGRSKTINLLPVCSYGYLLSIDNKIRTIH